MSKLVLHTQYCENYGDEESPRWKFKGGEVYVLENLNSGQLNNIENVAKFFADMISYANSMSEEYVISWSVVEDSAEVWDEWETPWKITYDGVEFFIEKFTPAEPWWSGNYAGKFEKRPISMGSLYDPEQVVVEYVEKDAA